MITEPEMLWLNKDSDFGHLRIPVDLRIGFNIARNMYPNTTDLVPTGRLNLFHETLLTKNYLPAASELGISVLEARGFLLDSHPHTRHYFTLG